MTPVQHIAAAAARRVGLPVFAPPAPPALGTVWTPTRTAAMARMVVSAGPDGVAYQRVDARTGAWPEGVFWCSVVGWARWRRRVRAG